MTLSRSTYDKIQFGQNVIVLIAVVNILCSIWTWSIVPSSSMEPTLNIGSVVVGSKDVENLEYGDIVTFFPNAEASTLSGVLSEIQHKLNKDTLYVKRLVGKAGDVIAVKDGYLYRNGEKIEEDYVKELCLWDFDEYTVPAGKYFFMGDNRNNSNDSRYIGPIPVENVFARVIWYN